MINAQRSNPEENIKDLKYISFQEKCNLKNQELFNNSEKNGNIPILHPAWGAVKIRILCAPALAFKFALLSWPETQCKWIMGEGN